MSGIAKSLAGHPKWKWEDHLPEALDRAGEPLGIPDLEHPATKGWLMAMLRDAYGEQTYFDIAADKLESGSLLHYMRINDAHEAMGATEGEMLGLAVLNAWSKNK